MTVQRELAGDVFAYGAPPVAGRSRAEADDFQVEEILGFEPSGEGCHVLLQVRKRDSNTEWVAQQLARCAGVPRRAVGYSGLKDRHAVTVQWFSVNLQGCREPDWTVLDTPELQILRVGAHDCKLRVGSHRANRFLLRLRDLHGAIDSLPGRLQAIAARGVPNLFGAQRFGRGGANVDRARALLRGELRIRDRKTRGICLSALRSYLFNRVLLARVAEGTWDSALDGEVLVLDGSNSYFRAGEPDAQLRRRVASGDVHPSGPLCGRGEPPTSAAVRALEDSLLAPDRDLVEALGGLGMRHERRSLRLPVRDLNWKRGGGGALEIGFELPRGSYATAVLRELISETGTA